MGYCRKCGVKLEEDMAYCPKCGTLGAIPSGYAYPPRRHESHPIGWSFGLAVVAVLIVVVVIFAALIVAGLLPIVGPFGTGGSGNLQTQQMTFSDFTSVDAGYGFDVIITYGSNYSVSITTDDNIMQYVNAKISGRTLDLGLTGIHRPTTLKAEISMPDLTAVSMSGGAKANVSDFNLTHNFQVNLSGGSRLNMTGQATDLIAGASGGSNFMLQELNVTNANVDLSGGSQGTVNVNGTLQANLSGGSHLDYRGTPTLKDINTSGGASISQVP